MWGRVGCQENGHRPAAAVQDTGKRRGPPLLRLPPWPPKGGWPEAGGTLSHLCLITVAVLCGPGSRRLCPVYKGPTAPSELLSLPASSEEAGGASKAKTTRAAHQAGLDGAGMKVSDEFY